MLNRTLLLTLSLGIYTATSLAAESAPGLADTIERWQNLRVDSGSVSTWSLRLSSGHLTVTLPSGSAAVVRAGNEAVGVFLTGTGTLEYRSVDPIEFPLVLHNLRTATSLSPQQERGSISIRGSFTKALWLTAGQPLPELSGGRGAPPEAAFREHLEILKRVQMSPVAHTFAEQRFNQPSSTLVWASFSGGEEDLMYAFDPEIHRSERLFSLRKSTSNDPEVRDHLYRTLLSSQPIGRDRRDPQPPPYLLTDVHMSLQASDGKEVAMTSEETLVLQKRRQSLIRFRLHSDVYAWVGSGVRQPRTFLVREVLDEGGRSLAFHHANGDLAVALAEPAEPDRPLKLKFRIDGDFLIRPGGDNFWILGAEPWFPQPEFGGQYYTWHALLRVKKPFVPFSSGATVTRRSEGDENVLEVDIDKPIQFAVVLAGKYEFEEQTKNGVKIRVATYVFRNARAMKQLADLASSIIEYYQAFLGPFPFPEFQILEINSLGFGQAPPGLMFITKEAFTPTKEENQYFSQGVNERFAHEIAHQYWGHVVKMPSLEEQWLTESFAEYCAALFLKQFRGESTYASLLAHWKSRANYAREAAPIPLANEIYDPSTGFIKRVDLLYDKGPYLLAALHKELGDDTFLTFLKSYQTSFRWKFGSTKTVEGLLKFLTKKDYGPFFEANYWGTGMPN